MCRYQQLDALKLKLDSFLPLPLEVVGNLRADLVLRWTYVYRKTNVIISGAEHVPPDAWRVQSDMENLISWCQGEGKPSSGGTCCQNSFGFCENPSFR